MQTAEPCKSGKQSKCRPTPHNTPPNNTPGPDSYYRKLYAQLSIIGVTGQTGANWIITASTEDIVTILETKA